MQATNAIWNAERYEAEVEARRDATRELETTSLLLRTADLLAGSLDLSTVLERAYRGDRTGYRTEQSGGDALRSERDGTCRAGGTRKRDPESRFAHLRGLSASEVRKSLVGKRPFVVDYDAWEPSVSGVEYVESRDVRLCLSAPLVLKGMVVGSIGVDEPGARREFAQREIEIVEGIASQAAVAIENVRLYEIERTIADRLQDALLTLPERVPGIEFAHAYHGRRKRPVSVGLL